VEAKNGTTEQIESDNICLLCQLLLVI